MFEMSKCGGDSFEQGPGKVTVPISLWITCDIEDYKQEIHPHYDLFSSTILE